MDGLWFVPGAIVLGAVLLAAGMVELSAHVDGAALARWPRLFGASADSSRSMLAAIATSMITVAGVTFSLTIVAVTQASSQYTPRLLRNFMRDRANKVVLGAFVGIFAYCLVVLRTIRSAGEGAFVPSLAVLLGVGLAVAGTAVLIFFVHHIASMLQASGIMDRVTRETLAAVDRLYPEPARADEAGLATNPSAPGDAEPRAEPGTAVPAPSTGYVQRVDVDTLLRVADARGVVVRMAHGVGEFVVEGTPLAWMAPTGSAPAPAEDAARAVSACYVLGSYRTVDQDPGFGVRQLVDIALKALSPGVNDTTTAVTCVDFLSAILARLAGRRVESPVRVRGGVARLMARGPTFESLLRAAFDEIRQNAGGNVTVLARAFDSLVLIRRSTVAPARVALLDEQVGLVDEVARRTVDAPYDRARLHGLAERAHAATRDTAACNVVADGPA